MKPQFYTALGYDYSKGEVPEVEAVFTKINQGFLPAVKSNKKAKRPKPKSPRLGGDVDDETMTSADAEFEYPSKAGRRRTYRRCRKCGLPKKPETK
jgi:hypothetical protein